MGLKRKIRTLLDPEKRLTSHYENQRRRCNERRSFPLTADSFLRGLDPAKLESILSSGATSEPGIHTVKYLEVEKWLTTNIRRVLNLGLDFQPRKRVLDLGSGAGYFLHVCNRLGHDVLGLDLPDPTAGWYGEIFELFGVRRVISRINPFVPLPDMGPRFDYVCGFMICFNDHQGENPWDIDQWRFFLDDLRTHLKPRAIVWFELNPGLNGAHYSAELQSFFESRGAIVDGKRLVWGLDGMHYRVLQRLAQLEALRLRRAADAGEGREGAVAASVVNP
jgi:SAM-dependent methyltransferase